MKVRFDLELNEPVILNIHLCRVWRYANNRPETQRQQCPRNARQQARIYTPGVALPPYETDQRAEWRVLRRTFRHD